MKAAGVGLGIVDFRFRVPPLWQDDPPVVAAKNGFLFTIEKDAVGSSRIEILRTPDAVAPGKRTFGKLEVGG